MMTTFRVRTELLESPGIKLSRFLGLESPEKRYRSWKIMGKSWNSLEKSWNSKAVVLEILIWVH